MWFFDGTVGSRYVCHEIQSIHQFFDSLSLDLFSHAMIPALAAGALFKA